MKKFDYKPIIMTYWDITENSIEGWGHMTLAKSLVENRRVVFNFNDIVVNVTPHMSVSDIVNNYHRKYDYQCYLYENSAQGMKNQTISRLRSMKEKRKNDKTLALIANEKFRVCYPFAYAAGKRVNQDPYGACIYRYAENWAKLMQVEMKAGQKLTQKLIDRTSRDADTEGMSGYSFSCAKQILIACWVHGAKLGMLMGNDAKDVRDLRWYTCINNARLAKTR